MNNFAELLNNKISKALINFFRLDASEIHYFYDTYGAILIAVAVSVAIFFFCYHFKFIFEVENYLNRRVSKISSSLADAILTEHQPYITRHFFDVSRATDLYNKYILTNIQSLLQKVKVQEDKSLAFAKVKIGIYETILILIICASIIYLFR